MRDVMEQRNEDKKQISDLLRTIISCLKDVKTASTENKEHIKRMRTNDTAGADAFVDNFMRRADLGDYIDMLSSKVADLEGSITHLTDMLGAIQGQKGSENMAVELGKASFKGKGNVWAWMEVNVPNSYLFGVFVDVYVVMEL
eukprot:15357074-Ditylum_brightwellii.AAC.1